MEPAVRQHLHSVTLRTLQAHSFNRASSLAAYTLTDILQQYLTLLALTSKQHAEHSGRTGQGCNVWDVLAALGEVGVELDELEEFVLGEAADMKPYVLTKRESPIQENLDAQEEEEQDDIISRRLDSLADIQTSLSSGLSTDSRAAIRLEYTAMSTPLLSSSPLSSPRSSSPLPSFLNNIHLTPPDMHRPVSAKGKERATHPFDQQALFDLQATDSMTMDISTPPPVVPPLVLPPSPPISERELSPTSSPDLGSAKRPRHASWNPPEHVPDFLPPFPGACSPSRKLEPLRASQAMDSMIPAASLSKQSETQAPPRRIPLPLRPAITSKSTYSKAIKYGQSAISVKPVDLPDQSLWDQGIPPTPGDGASANLWKKRTGQSSLQPLIAAYHVLQADPQPATNPSRLRVAHLLARTAPSRYSSADSLFAISSPTPLRNPAPAPTYAVPIPADDGTGVNKVTTPLPKLGNKVINDSIREADDLSSPWMQSNLTALTRSLLPPHLYSKATHLPPPPPLRPPAPIGGVDTPEPLTYHSPSLAPWSSALDSDEAKKRVGRKPLVRESPGKRLPDAQLYATWDWSAKHPEDPLVARRGRLNSYPTASFVGGVMGGTSGPGGGTSAVISAANSPNLPIRTTLGNSTPIKSPMLPQMPPRGFIVPTLPNPAALRGNPSGTPPTAVLAEVASPIGVNGVYETGVKGRPLANGIENGRLPDPVYNA